MNKAFTLLELLVVITIIAIIAVAVIGSTVFQLGKGRDARKIADLKELKIALENKAGDDACYPTSLPACGSEAYQPYIKEIPCDEDQDYFYYPEQGTTCPSWYQIFTNFESEGHPLIQDVGCLNGCGPTNTGTYNYEYFISNPGAPSPDKQP